jgi:predicted HTH domain antitoxin
VLWIIDSVRRICVGKGAELAGVDRWSFTRTVGERGVPAIAYPADDLRKDVATLEAL